MGKYLPAFAFAALVALAAGPARAELPQDCVSHEDPQRQITACSDFLDKNPRVAEAYNNRGFAFGLLRRFHAAIADFDTAINLNPKYAIAFNNRAVAYRMLGKEDAAIKDFEAAIEIDPDYLEAVLGKAISHRNLGDYASAHDSLDRAIKMNPKYGPTYRNKGDVFMRQQQFGEAIVFYNQALILDIRDADAYFNRGLAYEALGARPIAITNYRLALRYNPNLDDARKALERLGETVD